MNFQKPIQRFHRIDSINPKEKKSMFFYIIPALQQPVFSNKKGEKHQENFCCKFLSYKKFLHLGHWPSKQESTDVKKSWSYNKVAYHGVLQKKVMAKLSNLLGHMDEQLYTVHKKIHSRFHSTLCSSPTLWLIFKIFLGSDQRVLE